MTDVDPAGSQRPDDRPRGRGYGAALLLLASGGTILLLAYAMPWGTVEVPLAQGVAGSMRTVALTGRDLFPAAAAAGWIALAGIAGIVATRGWGRRAVSVLVLIAGLGGGGAAASFGLAAVDRLQAGIAGATGSPAGGVTTLTAWWLAAVAGGVAVVVMSLWSLSRGADWPSLGARYERSTPRELSAWQEQDLGRDPTDLTD